MSKIKVVCPECSKVFTHHQSKIRNGLSVSCPACGRHIVFDINSEDLNVRRALAAARRYRMNANVTY